MREITILLWEIVMSYKFGYYGNFATTYQTEVYIADALERVGHTVVRISRDNTDLIDCDYVLFGKLFKPDIIIKARKKKIPSICWVFDLYRGSPLYEGKDLIHYRADIVITTDGDDEYHTVRQAVHKPEKIMIEGHKVHNIIFVGTPYSLGGRKEMIDRVKPVVFRNKRGLDLNRLLGKTKIVLGDSYPATNYWSNRIYEITGRGGFLIHPKTVGLSNYIPQFERGKEREMINYYLENEKEREKIRKIQFEKCPTYDDRIRELIKIIKSKT